MVRARYTRAHPLLSLSLSVLVPRSSRDGRRGKEEGYDTRSARDSTHGQLVTLTTLVLFLDQTGDPTFARALTPRGTNGRKKGGTERGIRSGCSTRRG